METTTPAILLLADISGFTRFMRLRHLSTTHARHIIVRLLKTLVDAAAPPLQLAELEGDAAFFYALARGKDIRHVAGEVKQQILRFFEVFNRDVEALAKRPLCACEACTNVDKLKLKQVIHAGEVAIEQIDRFEKLFGFDVILVHGMLKNTVPSNEYVMMTQPAYAAFTDFFSLEPERRTETLGGVGDVETVVFYGERLKMVAAQLPNEGQSPKRKRMLTWKLKMHGHTIIKLLGLRKESVPHHI